MALFVRTFFLLLAPFDFLFGLSQRNKIKSLSTETKIAEFANSVDLDEGAHKEPPYLDLHRLPSCL